MAAIELKLKKNTNQPTISTNFSNFWQYTWFCLVLLCNRGILLEYAVSNIIDPLYLFLVQGLATIPVSAFFSPEHSKEFDKYIRICFVKVNSLAHDFSQVFICCSLGCPSHSFSLMLSHRRTPPWMQGWTSWKSGLTGSRTGHRPDMSSSLWN